MVTGALSLIDQDPTQESERGLSVADVERILDKIDKLTSEISEMKTEISRARSWQDAREENIQRFFEQDWAQMNRRLETMEARTDRECVMLSERIRETEKKVWAVMGAATIVGALLGVLLKGIQG